MSLPNHPRRAGESDYLPDSEPDISPLNFLIIPFLFDFAIASSGIITNLFGQDMGATSFHLGLIGAAWGGVYSVGAFVAGRLADRIPARRLTSWGLLVYFIGVTSCSFATSVTHLILLACVRGLGCALFWPAFETFLHVQGNAYETNKRLGLFNIGWTLGVTIGSAAGGALMVVGPRPVYRVLGTLALLLFGYQLVYLKAPQYKEQAQETDKLDRATGAGPSLVMRLNYLYISWVGHFVLFFVSGATATIFPKLARVEGIPDSAIGVILSMVHIGQVLTFLVLSRTSGWHYKLLPVLLLEAVALVGMVSLGFADSIVLYAVSMLALGLGRGMGYASSLFYALSVTDAKGANVGIHEMLVGSAFTFGPLLAGGVAQATSLRVSFPICASMIAIGWVIQASLVARRQTKTT